MFFNSILIKRRPWWSPLGTAVPANLSGGELAFNDVDKTLYYGLSTETAGISSIAIAGPGAFVSRTLAQDVSGSKTFKHDTTVDANLTVTGNLSVLGTQTVINTETINISGTSTQIDVVNNGTGTGITINQTGSQDVAEFKDDGATVLIVKDGGNVGVGTATPNEKLTVFGNVSASGNIYASSGDFTGALDVDGATTLNSTLGVTNAATFASTVSAQGALTVDGTATFNNDVTVVDKLQVQSTDFNPGVTGTHVEIEGTDVKVVACGPISTDTTYGLNGITTVNASAPYTVATDNSQNIVINANSGAADVDLTAANVNITTGDLEVQSGNLNGSGINYIQNFIIDGGTF